MFSNTSQVKVRYGETDQMGVVYHGNYPQYFEIGRIEWLRALGISYKEMEDQGIISEPNNQGKREILEK